MIHWVLNLDEGMIAICVVLVLNLDEGMITICVFLNLVDAAFGFSLNQDDLFEHSSF